MRTLFPCLPFGLMPCALSLAPLMYAPVTCPVESASPSLTARIQQGEDDGNIPMQSGQMGVFRQPQHGLFPASPQKSLKCSRLAYCAPFSCLNASEKAAVGREKVEEGSLGESRKQSSVRVRDEKGGHILIHIGLVVGKLDVRHGLGHHQAFLKGGFG